MTTDCTFVMAARSRRAAIASRRGCREVHGEAPRDARPVKVTEARPAEAQTGVRYAVSIQPYEQVPLAFKAGGYIDAVAQRRGADGRHARAAGRRPRARRRGRWRGCAKPTTASASTRRRPRCARPKPPQTKAQLDLDRARTLFAAQSLTKPDLDARAGGVRRRRRAHRLGQGAAELAADLAARHRARRADQRDRPRAQDRDRRRSSGRAPSASSSATSRSSRRLRRARLARAPHRARAAARRSRPKRSAAASSPAA